MSDFEFDDSAWLDSDDEDAAKNGVRAHARRYGAAVGYKAALALAADSTAPAQARSNAVRIIFDVAGMLNRQEDDVKKELHEMTWEELNQEKARVLRERALISARASGV